MVVTMIASRVFCRSVNGFLGTRAQLPSRSDETSYREVVAFERITVDPGRMGGVPCIRDLRVTVGMVLGQLAGGRTVEEVLIDYPYLERADVLAALEYAAAVVNEHEVPIARPA